MKKTKKKLSQIVICLTMALTLCLNGVGMIAATAADEPIDTPIEVEHDHENNEHVEHAFDENGVCADCDTAAQAKGGDSYYATVNEAIEAVVAAIAENAELKKEIDNVGMELGSIFQIVDEEVVKTDTDGNPTKTRKIYRELSKGEALEEQAGGENTDSGNPDVPNNEPNNGTTPGGGSGGADLEG